jgi:hypothetical protein
LKVTGGGLVALGRVGLAGDGDNEAVEEAFCESAPCSICFLLKLAARFRLGSLGGVPVLVLDAVTARFSLDFLLRLGNVAYLSKDLTMSYVLTSFLTVEIFDCLATVFRSVFFGSVLDGLLLLVSKWKDDDMLLGNFGGRSAVLRQTGVVEL